MSKKFKILWTQTAEKDLGEIIRYIAQDSPGNAMKILSKIKDKVDGLYVNPDRGRIIPELKGQGISPYRELVVAPWRIMFRISESKVYILSVLDSRRNVEDILLQRLIRENNGEV